MKAQKENYESAVTEGHFSVLYKRLSKIEDALESTAQYQQYEREQEVTYREL